VKKLLLALATLVVMLTGCGNDADVVSQNISTAADNFQIERRIVFYNTQSDTYMLTIEGLCSLGNADKEGELSVTCKIGPSLYKKHFLGLSRNVTYLVEQMDAAAVSPYHYKVVFKPSTVIPDLEVK
jgi:uncharacterized lipoprotein NlpE involved in copper resistance